MEDDDINSKYAQVKNELDQVSPSYCIAKWKEVTIHLDTGRTHSCHHPVTHKIPVNEILKNPSALHNTEFKKLQRKLMLDGQRPSECDYCWKVEDSNRETNNIFAFSDRIVKSTNSWARSYTPEILKKGWDDNTIPTSMEVNFGSICNFKCSYCNPEISSKWMEESKQHGGYKLSDGTEYNNIQWLEQQDRIPIPHKDYNPYIEAFWKWWPEIIDELKIFRITGGEPLLNKNTFDVLDYLIDNPKPNLRLSINSNLNVPRSLIDKFIKKMQHLQSNRSIKEFVLYTSCEAHGRKAEYIRYGLNYNEWLKNCELVLRVIPNSKLSLMSTFNLLSITSFKDMLKDMLVLKNRYTYQPERPHSLGIDIPYLRYPNFLTAWLMPKDWLHYIEDTVTWMYQNLQQTYWPPLCGKGFFDYEIKKMERIYIVCKESILNYEKDPKLDLDRRNLIKFVNEHDKRRGTNFLDTFPELENFYRTYNNG
jgi:organic radical activating enzyme